MNSSPINHAIQTLYLPLFALLALTLISLLDINQKLFTAVNQIHHYTGDTIWAYITLLGDPLIVLCISLSFMSINPAIAKASLLAMILGLIIVFSLKSGLGVLRPAYVLATENIHTIGRMPTSGALPSGHTTGVFMLATLLLFHIQNSAWRVGLIICALLAALARIVVGVHWPLDVAAGIILGWAIACFSLWLTDKTVFQKINIQHLSLILLIASTALIFRDTGYEQAKPLQWLVAISCFSVAMINMTKLNAK